MRIGLWTIDEVNRYFASRMARAAGVQLVLREPRDGWSGRGFDAAVYDLDYLPPEDRRHIIEMLTSQQPARLTAVLSRNLTPGEVGKLRRRGVRVCRRPSLRLFRHLAQPVFCDRLAHAGAPA